VMPFVSDSNKSLGPNSASITQAPIGSRIPSVDSSRNLVSGEDQIDAEETERVGSFTSRPPPLLMRLQVLLRKSQVTAIPIVKNPNRPIGAKSELVAHSPVASTTRDPPGDSSSVSVSMEYMSDAEETERVGNFSSHTRPC
jgi:hypothetical protein